VRKLDAAQPTHAADARERARLMPTLGPKMNDADFAATFVRYFLEGAKTDEWAPLELNQLAISDPERAWRIIQLINATAIEDESWREHVHAAVSGAVEELVVVNERTMLPVVLCAAKESAVLRSELGCIYQSSVSPSIWAQIQAVVAQQGAPTDVSASRPRS
jgi:hypothetical protein